MHVHVHAPQAKRTFERARAAARAVARVVAVAHQTRFAPPPSTPDTRLEPAERRRQRCGRRRPHTASSAVETAPRAATRCATTAAARLVAMDAPDPLCAAALNARYSVRAGGATAAETRSCGRRRPHTASSAVETASRAATRCATPRPRA